MRVREGARLRLWIGLLAGLLSGCGGSPADRSAIDALDLIAERTGRDRIRIRWDGAPDGTARIFAGSHPERIDRSRSVGELAGGQATLRGFDSSRPHYFELVPATGRPVVVSERLLPLEGHHHFRDLGGYQSADGRRVRWGLLFRSGELSGLTDRDLEYLSHIDLQLVCDFRTPFEREEDPDRLPAESPPQVALLGDSGLSGDIKRLFERIRSGDVEEGELRELMIEGSRRHASSNADPFRRMFQRVSDPANLPALVHCTGGKDRAGFASALLLMALGVPLETILQDYLLTNYFTHDHIERQMRMIRLVSLFRTDPAALRPVLGVERQFMQASFDTILANHGSVDAFLRDHMGITDAQKQAFRDLLLE
jgi:protein-tyrosine phosphatase